LPFFQTFIIDPIGANSRLSFPVRSVLSAGGVLNQVCGKCFRAKSSAARFAAGKEFEPLRLFVAIVYFVE